jgi:hypothetical protein
MKFIRNESGNALINTAQIASINLEEPKFEAKDYRVVAHVQLNGSYILFRGSKQDCIQAVYELEQKLNEK